MRTSSFVRSTQAVSARRSEIPAAQGAETTGAGHSSLPPADPGVASSNQTLSAFARVAGGFEVLSDSAIEALSEPVSGAISEPASATPFEPERASDDVLAPRRPSTAPPPAADFVPQMVPRPTLTGLGRRTFPPPAPRPARRSFLPGPLHGVVTSSSFPPEASLREASEPETTEAPAPREVPIEVAATMSSFRAAPAPEPTPAPAPAPAPSTVLTEPIAIPRRRLGPAPRPALRPRSSPARLAPGRPHDEHEALSPWQRLVDHVNGAYALVVSTGVLAYLLVELYLRHADLFLKSLATGAAGPGKGVLSLDAIVACTPGVIVCALPSLFSYSLIASGQRSLDTRLAFDVPAGPGSSGEGSWGAAFTEARLRWRHEKVHVASARRRTEQNGRLYGFLVSLSLCLCAMVAARSALFGAAPTTPAERVALAVATALFITFARDVGRMAVRVANRDASSRMLAWNIKRLLMTVVGTLLLSGFAFAGALPDTLQGPAGWLLMGGAMALFADQVMEAVGDRFAAVFGVKRPPPVDAESLRRLDGLGEDDLERLGEEGVDSIHA
ncbi:MAG TPA: hypothetical protein VFS00_20910, partial [Polyangiaceae bacterium]|nr:hypothetical protein [Polyangiaceae bacterium]